MERRLEADEGLGIEPEVSARGEHMYTIGGDYAGRGYALAVSGEVETMRGSFDQFIVGLLIAVVLIYLVMVAKFRSFVDPLMILFNIPLGFIGVATILKLTGTTLNIQSFMGMIMMVGIVAQYGIVLIDFANARVAKGMSVRDAVVEAACIRLRPIVMTSLVAALAVTPMAIGLGGSEADVPLARTIVGGVLGAGFLTLFVLPCMYYLMKRPPRGPTADATEPEAATPTGDPAHA